MASKKIKHYSQKKSKEIKEELKIKQNVKDFVNEKKRPKKGKELIKKKDYSVYHPNEYGQLANKYAKKFSEEMLKKHSNYFTMMFKHFKKVNMNILSKTYVSVMFFFTALSFPASLILLILLNFSFKLPWILIPFISILITIGTFIGFYFYPASLIGERQKKIKQDLPFALVHMSAVAGSGANPISIFELLAKSEEYPELKKEIKKILNYVNLFGYNLTTSLKSVSATTPSPEFKELLNGMISTIETGGDLKAYLREKSLESLERYKMDRKRQVEVLATYSEVYTAILIAAPLLLIITLAIINTIGGSIAGMSVNTIAWLGIGLILPMLNIGFMAFLTVTQPEI